MNNTPIPLYSRISLNRNFPEYNLKRGDVATFIDTVPDPEGIEEGYILEVFNALGESIDVVTVPKSAVSPLRSNDIPRVRSLLLSGLKRPRSMRANHRIIIIDSQKKPPKIKRVDSKSSKKKGKSV
jgi:hypothetical protein